MAKKKTPTKYPPFGNYVQAVDYGKLQTRLETVLSARAADSLVVDLFELEEACHNLRGNIKKLFRSLGRASEDATELHDVSSALEGNLLEFRYHIRGARRAVHKLYFKSRNMPPIDKMSDEELTVRAIKPTLDLIAKNPPNAGRPATRKTTRKARKK